MLQYQNSGCYDGQFTVYGSNSTGPQEAAGCSVLLQDIMPDWELQVARWIGLVLASVFFALAVYRLVVFYRRLPDSVPTQAYSLIALFDLAIVLYFVDPNAAFGLFPLAVRFLFEWIIAASVFSLLVLAAWGILFSVFKELKNRSESWLKPLQVKVMFVLIALSAFFSLYPTRNTKMQGIQILILVFLVIFLGGLGLFYGAKLLKLLSEHMKSSGQDFSRSIIKIKVLIVTMFLAVVITSAIDFLKALEYFHGDGEEKPQSQSEITKKFWRSTILTYFIACLVNLLALITFRASASTSKAKNKENLQDPSKQKGDSTKKPTDAVIVQVPLTGTTATTGTESKGDVGE